MGVQVKLVVFLFLIDKHDRIYLQRRFNTGFLDGQYEPPAGGVDQGEFPKQAACREVMEEAGVTVSHDDIELFHGYMNFNQTPTPYLGLMYRTRRWQGEPRNIEPHLSDDSGFYALDELPNVIPQVKEAVKVLLDGPSIDFNTFEIIENA